MREDALILECVDFIGHHKEMGEGRAPTILDPSNDGTPRPTRQKKRKVIIDQSFKDNID